MPEAGLASRRRPSVRDRQIAISSGTGVGSGAWARKNSISSVC